MRVDCNVSARNVKRKCEEREPFHPGQYGRCNCRTHTQIEAADQPALQPNR